MKKLFAFVMVGSNDLNKSGKFYDAVAIYLGIIKVKTTDKYISYAQINSPEQIEFYVVPLERYSLMMSFCTVPDSWSRATP